MLDIPLGVTGNRFGFMDFLAFKRLIKGGTTQSTVRVPKTILERVAKIKTEMGLSRSMTLIYLMVQGLERVEAFRKCGTNSGTRKEI